MDRIKIFVVEDDLMYAKLLEYQLSGDETNDVEIFSDGKSVLDNLFKNPDIITLDYSLPDKSGEEILSEIKKYNSDIQVVVISGQEDLNTAVSLLKKGAYDYIIKDSEAMNRIEKIIFNIKENIGLRSEVSRLKLQIAEKYSFKDMVGNGNEMKVVFHSMEKAIDSKINISLHGEVGVGKEKIAKTIHYNSIRKALPFVSLDFRAILSKDIEAKLLGVDESMLDDGIDKPGILEKVNGGTLYIEGIEDLNDKDQFIVRRIFQEKEITRLGGKDLIKIDVRIVISYSKQLKDLIANKKVLESQYYRSMGIPINVPPLRDRGADIILLANDFVNKFVIENEMEKVLISPEAQDKLMQYPFVGNINELKAVVELATVMSSGGIIKREDITFSSSNNLSDFLFQEKTLKDYTRGIIKHYLYKYENNVLLVADKLEVGKSTIYRMLKNNEI